MLASLASYFDTLGVVALYFAHKLQRVLLTPGGAFSLASLASALSIALMWLGWRHRSRKRPWRLKVVLRAVFPRRLIRSRSTRADIGFFFFNTFVAGLLFGWAILSGAVVSKAVTGGLESHFGALSQTALPDWLCISLLTVVAFVAYEFGYWLDHYLSHRVPFLWEFHKVHHTAEVLSPLTNYRVHPVDSIVFVNILAVVMGGTQGALNYLLGKPVSGLMLWNINALVLVFTYLLDHLHHTQFWIAFTGVWGRILISPAHHQIHHSTNPIHFNRNMGSCLAVWDWLFGTLHIPSPEREKLVLGVEPREPDPHGVTANLLTPVVRAIETLRPTPQGAAAARPRSQPVTS